MLSAPILGILLAIIALFSWGFTDFYIQKSSRLVGVWKNLFTTGILGFVFLFPFVKNEIFLLGSKDLIILFSLGVVILFAQLFNFEALEKGKIAVVEPLLGMELPITVAFSIGFGKDHLNTIEFFLIGVIFIGLLLVVIVRHKHLHQTRTGLEKGMMLAIAAAIAGGLTNFLVGFSSRQISPLMVIWFAHTQVAIVALFYLIYVKNFRTIVTDLKSTLVPGILYNLGWVSFAVSTTMIATAVVTAISESYIILGVLLGIFVNHEKIKKHQVVGIVLVSCGIIALSMFTEGI